MNKGFDDLSVEEIEMTSGGFLGFVRPGIAYVNVMMKSASGGSMHGPQGSEIHDGSMLEILTWPFRSEM